MDATETPRLWRALMVRTKVPVINNLALNLDQFVLSLTLRQVVDWCNDPRKIDSTSGERTNEIRDELSKLWGRYEDSSAWDLIRVLVMFTVERVSYLLHGETEP